MDTFLCIYIIKSMHVYLRIRYTSTTPLYETADLSRGPSQSAPAAEPGKNRFNIYKYVPTLRISSMDENTNFKSPFPSRSMLYACNVCKYLARVPEKYLSKYLHMINSIQIANSQLASSCKNIYIYTSYYLTRMLDDD